MIKLNEIKNNEELERAKKADLITLPNNIKGTNCGNCKFIKDGYCFHSKIKQNVANNQCCIYWDAEGVKREWKND